MYVSLTCLGGCGVSSWGVSAPILALKSPHIMVVSCGCVWSIVSSIWDVASASVIPRRFRDAAGGRYMLTTFIL